MSSTYISSVFRSGSPRNDAGPLAERTAPTLTWAAADPAVTDAARPINKAAIVIFCIIGEPSPLELAKSTPEARRTLPSYGAAVTGPVFDPIWQGRYFCLALSQAHPVRAVPELTHIKTSQGQLFPNPTFGGNSIFMRSGAAEQALISINCAY